MNATHRLAIAALLALVGGCLRRQPPVRCAGAGYREQATPIYDGGV